MQIQKYLKGYIIKNLLNKIDADTVPSNDNKE